MLREALGRDEVLRMAQAHGILRDWEAIVGPGLAERSQPDRYERGTVWVAVTGSAWAQELRMIKPQILARLGERAGNAELFKDIRFGVRPIRQDAVGEPEPDPGPPPPPPPRPEGSIREIAERRLRKWMDRGDPS